MKDSTISRVMAEMGRRGGKAGSREDKIAAGKRSANRLTKAERTARARKAGLASGAARKKSSGK